MSHYSRWPSIILPALLAGALCVAALTPGRLLGDAPVTVTAAAAASQPAATQAAINASPEAVFKRWQEAAAAKDYGGFLECFTEDGQNYLIGKLALSLSATLWERAQARTQPGVQPSAEQRIYDKYKLGELAENKSESHPDGDLSFSANAPQRLGAQIPNKRAFAAEAITQALEDAQAQGKSPLDQLAKATLTNVKIDGDQATGVFNINGEGPALRFKKVNGSWVIERMSAWVQWIIDNGK